MLTENDGEIGSVAAIGALGTCRRMRSTSG